MGRKLFVGNLGFRTGEEQIKQHFAQCGVVTSVKLVIDRETGRPRGFGFVEFERESEAELAIAELHHKDLDGRDLNVDFARERESREPYKGKGGNNGGGSGGRW